jgi:hypothetical protein
MNPLIELTKPSPAGSPGFDLTASVGRLSWFETCEKIDALFYDVVNAE